MECKKCGIENDDSAVYCKSCGSRLDGKIKCPGCGEYNDEGSAFCVHCGARIDGKKPCPRCGTLSDGKFCQACGASLEEKKTSASDPVKSQPAPKSTAAPVTYYRREPFTLWQKILRIVGNSLAMAAVTFAVAFMFMSGLKTTLGGEANPKVTYYFLEIFNDVDKIITANPDSNTAPLLLQAIIAFGIYAAMLIYVFVNWITSLVNFIKTTKGGCRYTILVKAASAVCFYILANMIVLTTYYSYIDYSGEVTKMTLNKSTETGIAVSAVLILVAVLCIAASEWRKGNTAHNIVKYVTTACGIASAAIMLSVLYTNGVGSTVSSHKVVTNAFTATYVSYDEIEANAFLLGCGGVFNIIAVAFFGGIVKGFVEGIEDYVEKNVIVNSAVCFGFIVTAVSSLRMGCQGSEMTVVNAIPVAICGAVTLAVAITTFVLRKKFVVKPPKPAAPAPEEQPAQTAN